MMDHSIWCWNYHFLYRLDYPSEHWSEWLAVSFDARDSWPAICLWTWKISYSRSPVLRVDRHILLGTDLSMAPAPALAPAGHAQLVVQETVHEQVLLGL
jgi:hypothetical protein